MTSTRTRTVITLLVLAATAACCTTSDADRVRPAFDRPARRHTATRSTWSTTLPNWAFAIQGDGDGAVVIAGDGDILALDAGDGRERWRTVAPRAFLYEPAIDPETVIVSARDRFVALERASGAARWEIPVSEEAGAARLTSAGDSEVALLTTEQGSVLAVDAESGATLWSARYPGGIVAAPAVDSDAGLAAITWHGGDAPMVRVLEVASGAVRWEAAIGSSTSAPVVVAGLVVTGEGDAQYTARVIARDLGTGAEEWSVTVPASFEPSLTPGVHGTDVAIADHFGTVTMLDARRGRVRWQSALEQPVLETPILMTSTAVVLKSFRGNVVVLDRDTGRVLERDYPGGYPAGLALAGGKLLVALRLTDPGRVVARPAP